MTENKGDLISREWLEDAFDNLCCHNCKKCRNFRNEDSFYKCALIDNAPTVDLSAKWAEAHSMGYDVGYTKGLEDARPKGEWKLHGMIYYCSNCGKDYEQGGNNFCGQCGADMRDAIRRIAEQYSEHHELIPEWLSIGDMKGGAES